MTDTESTCWICRKSPAAGINGCGDPHGPALASPVCGQCADVVRPNEAAWRVLSRHLHGQWSGITARGQFDLSGAFGGDVAAQALRTHLFFVQLLAGKLREQTINVDLASFSTALLQHTAHPEVTLLVATSSVPSGRLVSWGSEVNVLRSADEVDSALWTHLAHPVAVKICYVRHGAPVHEPAGFPWHPARQRKIVKLSPFKGDTQPWVARRDLRI